MKSILEWDVVVINHPDQVPPIPVVPKPIVVPPIHTSKILDFCNAIKEYEGYFPPGVNPKYPNGSPSFVHKNPGNIREWGDTPIVGGFCQFPTYDEGWNALVTIVTNACTGKSHIYTPTMSIIEFFERYSPSSDGNEPTTYANWVAKKIGVHPDDILSSLV